VKVVLSPIEFAVLGFVFVLVLNVACWRVFYLFLEFLARLLHIQGRPDSFFVYPTHIVVHISAYRSKTHSLSN